MKEALLYDKEDNDVVKCNVCHVRCLIKAGKRGACGVRENHDGTLYAINYGKTIAASVDPIEKKPLYYFHPKSYIYSLATVGCNMRCMWCQNYRISQDPKDYKPIIGKDVDPKEHVNRALKHGVKGIAYTYTEPTIFLEYALAIMKEAKQAGLYNVWVSNGYMTKETLDMIMPYLDAINIDLKASNDETHLTYTGTKLSPIIDNLAYLNHTNIHVEITTLVIPGVNDQEDDLRHMAKIIKDTLGADTPWHISRFFPAWKMQDKHPTHIDTLKKAKQIGQDVGLTRIHLGNI